ncbi:hypothetical protein [Gemmatimonas sp.]|uniref:hypothetical protein n=1 Tax=Gemmatimonas sp. TaxID=1962908 RepID=UPI0033406280
MSQMMKYLSVAACVLVGATTACRKTDFTEAATPMAATALALQAQQVGDSAHVYITLGGGSPATLGSLTGDVVSPDGWRFVSCAAQQAEALLACKAHDATVRVAAAWAGGTHAGELVRVTYARAVPGATITASAFTMSITEAHGVRGQSLLDELEVRRESVVRTDGAGGTP